MSLYNGTVLDSADYAPPVRCRQLDPDATLWSYMQYFSQRPYLADIEYVPYILSTYHKFKQKYDKIHQCKNRDVIWVALICRLHVELHYLMIKVREQFDQFLEEKTPRKEGIFQKTDQRKEEAVIDGVIIDDEMLEELADE